MLRRASLAIAPVLVSCLVSVSTAGCRDAAPVAPAPSAIEAEMGAHLDGRIAKHLGKIQAQLEKQKLALW